MPSAIGNVASSRASRLADQRLEPVDVAGAEVELGQLGVAVATAGRDLVEDVLHAGGELVGDLPREVLLQQPDHRERQPGGHQRGALLVDVAAVEDRADDRGVRRRAADLPLLQLTDQRGFGVARRRLGLVAGGPDRRGGHGVALGDRGQPGLPVVGVALVVAALDVGLEEAVEGDHPAGGENTASSPVLAVPPSRTVTERPSASFIWEATVRIQIVEPELVPLRPVCAGVRKFSPAGRIASCASWAFLTLEVYVRG